MALKFDGANDYVNIKDAAGLRLTGSMTLMLWVNQGAMGAYQGLLTKMGDGTHRAYDTVFLATGVVYFYVASDASTVISRASAGTYNNSVWRHIAGVYDASAQTMHFYGDGALDDGALAGVVPAAQYSNNGMDVCLGTRLDVKDTATISKYSGYMMDARIYNAALTAAQISHIRESYGADNLTTNLVARWILAEGPQLSTTGPAVDWTGNGYAGTLTNGPVYYEGRLRLRRPLVQAD
jgi:hypothetical protein